MHKHFPILAILHDHPLLLTATSLSTLIASFAMDNVKELQVVALLVSIGSGLYSWRSQYLTVKWKMEQDRKRKEAAKEAKKDKHGHE